MSQRRLPARDPSVLLRSDSTLCRLYRTACRLAHLQMLLEQHLQPAARPWCKVAALREGVLTLLISNAQWATHLRYQQQRLLRQLVQHPELENLTKIIVRVQPTIGESRQHTPPPLLPESAAETLRTTADTVSHPQLRAALQRLAQHTADHRDRN